MLMDLIISYVHCIVVCCLLRNNQTVLIALKCVTARLVVHWLLFDEWGKSRPAVSWRISLEETDVLVEELQIVRGLNIQNLKYPTKGTWCLPKYNPKVQYLLLCFLLTWTSTHWKVVVVYMLWMPQALIHLPRWAADSNMTVSNVNGVLQIIGCESPVQHGAGKTVIVTYQLGTRTPR